GEPRRRHRPRAERGARRRAPLLPADRRARQADRRPDRAEHVVQRERADRDDACRRTRYVPEDEDGRARARELDRVSERRVMVAVGSGASTEEYGELAAFFDAFADEEPRWRRRNRTYHRMIERVVAFQVPPGSTVLEIGSGSGDLLAALAPSFGVGVDV